MEDDIDIEEHDVLDNPKIRDIFPDLSLVKIEVPDDDYQDEYEKNQEYVPQLDYPYNVKNEVPSDEENATSYDYEQSVQSASVYEQNEQSEPCVYVQSAQREPCVYVQSAQSEFRFDYEQNDTSDYDEEGIPYNNKIILGTKPIDYNVLYEEALHSTVSVFLENWESKLMNSPCYCQSCEILFPTVNALDAHNSISHSFLVALDVPPRNTARKSTVNTSSTYCNHCDKTFPNDTALIKHLYELLPLNNFQQTPQPVKVEAKSSQFKCVKCKKYFATYADGKRHKKLAHPTLTDFNIIVRVLNNVERPLPVLEKKKSEKAVLLPATLVPKSVLFQCHICQINFLSCFSAIQHSKSCVNKNYCGFQKCNICKRKIRSRDTYLHEIQHKYSDKLKIYTINWNMFEKVLLKCPKCSVCYDEKLFSVHRRNCNSEERNFVRCNICLVDINQFKYSSHKTLHVSKKYTKKDFIIVEFCDTAKLGNEINQMQIVPKMKKYNDTTLYYCSSCGTCKGTLSLRGHANSSCKKLSVSYCEVCGLGFGKKTFNQHRMLHTMKKLTLNDFKIISLHTRQHIVPPISNFYKCHQCNIHFLTKSMTRLHSCDTEPFRTCNICNKKFNLKAYVPHSNFHTHRDIPELIKKYNSINNIWNVVYLCSYCELVTLTYDSAIEHSQSHINDLEAPASQICPICDFNIIQKSFKTHMNLHENNKSINRKKFTILKYDHRHLFNAEWMDMFANLPKQHKFQILSKSIYRYTRRVKLNVEINCQTDDKKYFCKKCKTSVTTDELKQHSLTKICKNSSKFTCRTCRTKFPTLHECIAHENQHESIPKIYKIITFNDQKDEIFDQRLKDYELSCKPVKTETEAKVKPIKLALNKKSIKLASGKKAAIKLASKVKKTPVAKKLLSSKALLKCGKRWGTVKTDAEKTNRIKLYKCQKCSSCISIKKNMMNHSCTSHANRRRLCKICKEYFYFRHLRIHLELHRSLPKLPEKPLIIYFNPSVKTLPVASIFQCECGLHFTSKQSIENHLNICNDNLEVSKEICSKCNLLFPTDVLVTHLCKHHSKPVDIKIETVERTNRNPYICASCNVVYPTISSFEDHLFFCPVKVTKKCPVCKQLYDNKTFGNHACHINQEMTVVRNSSLVTKVYRCDSCDLTYLYRKSYNYHIVVKHVNKRDIVPCEVCKLKFTAQILSKHMAMHDPNENYIIKVIDPQTDKYKIIKGRNYKLDCNRSKHKDSALNTSNKAAKSPKKSIESANQKTPTKVSDKKMTPKMINQKISPKVINQKISTKVINQKISTKVINQKISPKVINQKMTPKVVDKKTPRKLTDQKTPAAVVSTSNKVRCDALCKVYRCSICDICNLNKRRLDYHFQVNHKNKRSVKACDVCGLRFVHNVLLQHMSVHETGETYTLNVFDSDTGKTRIVTGKNLPKAPPKKSTSKRRSRFDEDSVSAKKAKADDSENFADKTAKAVSENKGIVDHELSTSKFDFESVNMSLEDNTICTDENDSTIHNIADPLNNSAESILPDVTNSSLVNDNIDQCVISKSLKKVLDTHVGKYTNNLYKCMQCCQHFLADSSVECHLKRTDHKKPVVVLNCSICGLGFSKKSLTRHVYIHHKRMGLNDAKLFNIINVYEDYITNKSGSKDKVRIGADIGPSVTKNHYYKCADCNVCYIDELTCRKHLINHNSLDPKTYIECKICNFQFLIDSLKKHMNLHHSSEFRLEDLVVREYTATGDSNPKIDVYRGIDKVQSRLVSTTTDVPVENSETDGV